MKNFINNEINMVTAECIALAVGGTTALVAKKLLEKTKKISPQTKRAITLITLAVVSADVGYCFAKK